MITQFRDEYFFLSSFHRSAFTLWGYEWPSREHAFQARKNWSAEHVRRVLAAPAPADAKKLGRECSLRPDWDQVKKREMLQIVLASFGQHPDLAQMLAATYPHELVEGNTWRDDYWGCVPVRARSLAGESIDYFGPGPAKSRDSNFPWRGRNHLGKILMAVRDVLIPD